MSLRIDTTELISGAYVIGETGLGVLGSAIPSTGLHGASYLYNDLSLPADNGKEIRGLIVTPPSAGTFYAWEDGSFSFTGAPDGSYSLTYRLFVDGVDLGTAVATLTVGVDGLSGTVTLDGITVSGLIAGYIPPEPLTNAEMREMYGWVFDLAKLHGLVAGTNLVVTPTSRTAGDLVQSIASAGDTVTVSRAA